MADEDTAPVRKGRVTDAFGRVIDDTTDALTDRLSGQVGRNISDRELKDAAEPVGFEGVQQDAERIADEKDKESHDEAGLASRDLHTAVNMGETPDPDGSYKPGSFLESGMRHHEKMNDAMKERALQTQRGKAAETGTKDLGGFAQGFENDRRVANAGLAKWEKAAYAMNTGMEFVNQAYPSLMRLALGIFTGDSIMSAPAAVVGAAADNVADAAVRAMQAPGGMLQGLKENADRRKLADVNDAVAEAEARLKSAAGVQEGLQSIESAINTINSDNNRRNRPGGPGNYAFSVNEMDMNQLHDLYDVMGDNLMKLEEELADAVASGDKETADRLKAKKSVILAFMKGMDSREKSLDTTVKLNARWAADAHRMAAQEAKDIRMREDAEARKYDMFVDSFLDKDVVFASCFGSNSELKRRVFASCYDEKTGTLSMSKLTSTPALAGEIHTIRNHLIESYGLRGGAIDPTNKRIMPSWNTDPELMQMGKSIESINSFLSDCTATRNAGIQALKEQEIERGREEYMRDIAPTLSERDREAIPIMIQVMGNITGGQVTKDAYLKLMAAMGTDDYGNASQYFDSFGMPFNSGKRNEYHDRVNYEVQRLEHMDPDLMTDEDRSRLEALRLERTRVWASIAYDSAVTDTEHLSERDPTRRKKAIDLCDALYQKTQDLATADPRDWGVLHRDLRIVQAMLENVTGGSYDILRYDGIVPQFVSPIAMLQMKKKNLDNMDDLFSAMTEGDAERFRDKESRVVANMKRISTRAAWAPKRFEGTIEDIWDSMPDDLQEKARQCMYDAVSGMTEFTTESGEMSPAAKFIAISRLMAQIEEGTKGMMSKDAKRIGDIVDAVLDSSVSASAGAGMQLGENPVTKRAINLPFNRAAALRELERVEGWEPKGGRIIMDPTLVPGDENKVRSMRLDPRYSPGANGLAFRADVAHEPGIGEYTGDNRQYELSRGRVNTRGGRVRRQETPEMQRMIFYLRKDERVRRVVEALGLDPNSDHDRKLVMRASPDDLRAMGLEDEKMIADFDEYRKYKFITNSKYAAARRDDIISKASKVTGMTVEELYAMDPMKMLAIVSDALDRNKAAESRRRALDYKKGNESESYDSWESHLAGDERRTSSSELLATLGYSVLKDPEGVLALMGYATNRKEDDFGWDRTMEEFSSPQAYIPAMMLDRGGIGSKEAVEQRRLALIDLADRFHGRGVDAIEDGMMRLHGKDMVLIAKAISSMNLPGENPEVMQAIVNAMMNQPNNADAFQMMIRQYVISSEREKTFHEIMNRKGVKSGQEEPIGPQVSRGERSEKINAALEKMAKTDPALAGAMYRLGTAATILVICDLGREDESRKRGSYREQTEKDRINYRAAGTALMREFDKSMQRLQSRIGSQEGGAELLDQIGTYLDTHKGQFTAWIEGSLYREAEQAVLDGIPPSSVNILDLLRIVQRKGVLPEGYWRSKAIRQRNYRKQASKEASELRKEMKAAGWKEREIKSVIQVIDGDGVAEAGLVKGITDKVRAMIANGEFDPDVWEGIRNEASDNLTLIQSRAKPAMTNEERKQSQKAKAERKEQTIADQSANLKNIVDNLNFAEYGFDEDTLKRINPVKQRGAILRSVQRFGRSLGVSDDHLAELLPAMIMKNKSILVSASDLKMRANLKTAYDDVMKLEEEKGIVNTQNQKDKLLAEQNEAREEAKAASNQNASSGKKWSRPLSKKGNGSADENGGENSQTDDDRFADEQN